MLALDGGFMRHGYINYFSVAVETYHDQSYVRKKGLIVPEEQSPPWRGRRGSAARGESWLVTFVALRRKQRERTGSGMELYTLKTHFLWHTSSDKIPLLERSTPTTMNWGSNIEIHESVVDIPHSNQYSWGTLRTNASAKSPWLFITRVKV